MDVHAGFPIIQNRVLAQISFDENFGTDLEIKHSVRNKRDAVNVSNPRGIHAAHNGPRHERVDIAVGKDDKPGAKRRKNYVLELVGKVGRVKQAERSRAQNISRIACSSSRLTSMDLFKPTLTVG